MKKHLYSTFLPFFLGIFLILSSEGYSHHSSSSSSSSSSESHHHSAHFRLADFRGNFVVTSTSIGGIDRSDVTPSIGGLSTVGVGQASFGRSGRGTLNFVSVSQYTGPILAPSNLTSFNLAGLNIVLTLTDPILGVGTLVVENYPTPGSNLNATFVAFKRDELVDKFIANVTSFSGTAPFINTGANLLVVERQTD